MKATCLFIMLFYMHTIFIYCNWFCEGPRQHMSDQVCVMEHMYIENKHGILMWAQQYIKHLYIKNEWNALIQV